ncbi:hypothetical protein, partial [Parapedobacter lycopersici]|uniref:hypothetical protein n=1 Tax=Parapedobacter lycopersici TaxID=1864939 RepID=UPI00333EECD5
ITIDGQTTLPNRFGQDNIILNSSSYPAEGDAGFLLSIVQTKANGSRDPVFDFSSDGAQFNGETPVGTTYTANFFHALQLSAPELDGFEYDKGRHGNQGEITLSVEENSDQQIRFRITGTVMKWEGGVENPQEVALVPIEAEFTIARSNYIETTSGGGVAAGVSCECKEE